MSYQVHVSMLDSDGEFADAAFRDFHIVPVPGDFITLGFMTWEVLNRTVHAGTDVHAADLTVKAVE